MAQTPNFYQIIVKTTKKLPHNAYLQTFKMCGSIFLIIYIKEIELI